MRKRKKFFVILFILASIGLFIFAGIVLKNNNRYTPPAITAPIEIPADGVVTDFNEVEKSDRPAVIMFYVDWCTYCRRFMPVFGDFAKQYKDNYIFAAINCDKPENIKYVQEYHIMGFPTLYIVDTKINHKFSLSMSATANETVMKEELNNYLNVRKNFL